VGQIELQVVGDCAPGLGQEAAAGGLVAVEVLGDLALGVSSDQEMDRAALAGREARVHEHTRDDREILGRRVGGGQGVWA
jgi:hypothetical protein